MDDRMTADALEAAAMGGDDGCPSAACNRALAVLTPLLLLNREQRDALLPLLSPEVQVVARLLNRRAEWYNVFLAAAAAARVRAAAALDVSTPAGRAAIRAWAKGRT